MKKRKRALSSFNCRRKFSLCILKHLNFKELAGVSLVCKQFHVLSHEDTLWSPFCKQVGIAPIFPQTPELAFKESHFLVLSFLKQIELNLRDKRIADAIKKMETWEKEIPSNGKEDELLYFNEFSFFTNPDSKNRMYRKIWDRHLFIISLPSDRFDSVILKIRCSFNAQPQSGQKEILYYKRSLIGECSYYFYNYTNNPRKNQNETQQAWQELERELSKILGFSKFPDENAEDPYTNLPK